MGSVTYQTTNSGKSSTKRTSGRRHTVNLPLLLITLGVVVVALPSLYYWYKYCAGVNAAALRKRAETLHEEGDFSGAISNYQRYLLARPDDSDALLKLVDAYSAGEESRSRLPQLNSLLYRALGQAPTRHDLRLLLASNLLEMRAFEEAKVEAEKVLVASPDDAAAANKVTALANMALTQVDDRLSVEDAIAELLVAAEQLPGDAMLIAVTATALRENPKPDVDRASIADQLMDALVKAAPDDIDAWLARYRYRTRFRLPDAENDLQAALELDEDNIDALLLSAAPTAEGSSDEQEREATLRRVIELAPSDSSGYLPLADLLVKRGDVDEAIDLLAAGQEVVENEVHDFLLRLALADTQLQAEKSESAKASLDKLESESAFILAKLDSSQGEALANRLRLLQGRLAAAEGQHKTAIAKLQSVVVNDNSQNSRTWIEAVTILAELHGEAGRADKASEYWGLLAQAFPGEMPIVAATVDSLLAANNPEQALELIDSIETPSTHLRIRQAQAHLSIQLSRPPEERNWTEFSNALATAKTSEEPSSELVFAEVQYLMVTDKKAPAIAMLRDSEATFADEASFWPKVALAYQELGEEADVDRALAKYEQLANSVVDFAKLKTVLLVQKRDYEAADKLLGELAQSANAEDQDELLRLRAELLASAGKYNEAIEMIEDLLKKKKASESLLILGIDVALAMQQFDKAKQLEQQLAEATEDGFDSRFAKARRLLLSYDVQDFEQRRVLERLIDDLRAERPKWFPVVTLGGRFLELNGEPRRALIEYQRAVDLGDRRTTTVQRTVALLYESGRFNEVDRYMAMVASDEETQFFDAMAVEVATRQGQEELAVELARESAERHPNDPLRRLYLGALLLRLDNAEEAVAVLEQAAKDFPEDDRVWPALFNAYVRSDRVEFARKALDTLASSSLLSADRRHFVAGQGYEVIGELSLAKEQYQLALKAQPSNVDIRLRYANLLSRQDAREARKELERVLELDPSNALARRQLAVLLATSRNQADWQRASQLLTSAAGTSAGDATTSDRLRALLLSQQGRTRSERIENCKLAREIVEPLIERGGGTANDLNRTVLADILQREASLSGDESLLLAARDQFRAALNEGPPSSRELSNYIEFLLRFASEELAEEAEDGQSTEKSRREDFLADAQSRLKDLKRLQTTGDEETAALVIALTARLHQVREEPAEAKAVVAEYIEQNKDTSDLDERALVRRYLRFGQLYSTIGEYADAEQWYRRLMETSPEAYLLVAEALVAQGKRSEAAALALQANSGNASPAVAKVLARIMTVTDKDVEVAPEVEEALAKVVDANSDDIELLQAQAVMRASRGDYTSAIAYFRRILELAPNDALTLNNLATLLGERPNQRAEALELIQRAIDVAGRNPMFLDTQGTIYFKLGEADSAIASLEEATAGRTTDARYYLHLAAAYKLGGRDDDARQMLSEAQAFGLENFVLTEDDRELLSTLEESLGLVGAASND